MTSKIDELDRQIIAILQQDGRASNVDIARRVGVTEATIRKRLDRLLTQKVIRITAVPDHVQMGLPIETVISLQLDMGNLEQIVGPLIAVTNVRSIKITTGEYDVILNAFFASEQELFRFLTDTIAKIPGVRKTVTTHVLHEVKDAELNFASMP
jgi:Lrp/AsnC family transcriptional regulator, regulator for asnA, asnC and gidA